MKKQSCLIDGCPTKKISCRGICATHYYLILNLIKKGVRTWEDFERVGMSLKLARARKGYKKEILDKMMGEKFKK